MSDMTPEDWDKMERALVRSLDKRIVEGGGAVSDEKRPPTYEEACDLYDKEHERFLAACDEIENAADLIGEQIPVRDGDPLSDLCSRLRAFLREKAGRNV